MNAILLLKQQHRKTKAALQRGSEGKLDPKEAKKAADELVAHMVIEEHVFYPRVRQLQKKLVSESYEEHTVARFELARCLTARGDEQVKSRFKVLLDIIEHHAEEEENELFPKVQRAIDADELERLGTRMKAMFDEAVDIGLEGLVMGPTHDLRRPNGNGATRTRSPGYAARSSR